MNQPSLKTATLAGNTVPVEPQTNPAEAALDRLGAAPASSQAAIDYQERRSTQVPTGRLVSVKKRISRKIGYNNVTISDERRAQ